MINQLLIRRRVLVENERFAESKFEFVLKRQFNPKQRLYQSLHASRMLFKSHLIHANLSFISYSGEDKGRACRAQHDQFFYLKFFFFYANNG